MHHVAAFQTKMINQKPLVQGVSIGNPIDVQCAAASILPGGGAGTHTKVHIMLGKCSTTELHPQPPRSGSSHSPMNKEIHVS